MCSKHNALQRRGWHHFHHLRYVPDQSSSHTTRNIILIFLLVIVLAGAGVAWWINSNYKEIIRDKLPEVAAKATDSTYQIKAGDVSIDLPGRSIYVQNLELVPDKAQMRKLKKELNLPQTVLKIFIPRLDITGISWTRLAADKVLECDSIRISNPLVRVAKMADRPQDKDGTADEPSRFKAIFAGHIIILNPDIAYTDSTAKSATSFAAKGGGIRLDDWRFELDKPDDTSRLFYAASVAFRFLSFHVDSRESMYKTSSGMIEYDNRQNNVRVNDLRMKPAVSKEEFYRRTGFQKEIYDIHIPALSLTGLDVRRLLYGGTLMAKGGSIDQASINIYLSRVPPPNIESKNGKFPHQLLLKLAMPVDIPQLDIRNGRFAYTEKNENSLQEGTISMNSINGNVRNITNMPDKIRKNGVASIYMKGLFKGSPIAATFRFILGSRTGAFTVEGVQSPMDGTLLNDITRPLALTSMTSLKLGEIHFRINGDERGATGQLTMPYQDLRADLLKPDDGGLNKKGVTSFLANKLLLFPDNPMRGRDVRTVKPSVERDDKKSFFNLVWKTIFNGALQTTSRDLIKVDKVVEKRAKKKEEKRIENEPPAPRPARRR